MNTLPMHSVMFHANDDDKHVVHWSDVAAKWICSNDNGLIKQFRHLCQALTYMHTKTGGYWEHGDTEKYQRRVPNHWTIGEY